MSQLDREPFPYLESRGSPTNPAIGTVNLSEIWAEKRDPHDGKWRYSVLF